MDKIISLCSPVSALKGVGPKQAEAFAKLGVKTVGDLLTLYPRAYEDRRKLYTIRELTPGISCRFLGMVAEQPVFARLRGGLTALKLHVVDDSGSLRITYFNAPFLRTAFQVGTTYQFFGRITGENGKISVISPEFEKLDGDEAPEGAILPVYPLTAGLNRRQVTHAVRMALDACGDAVEDILPDTLLEKHDLLCTADALPQIHFPADDEGLAKARRRIIFEELFILALGLATLKQRRTGMEGHVYPKTDDTPLRSLLPFRLTDAQERVIAEASADMAAGQLMNRLVQGDVGSGKTLVAAFLAWQVIRAGGQAALMAPTEILATQHCATFRKLFDPLGIRTVLVTGKMTAAQKRETYSLIASGAAQMVIGTHAVISQGVEFADLGLVICDEQQRFGVNQRAALSAKGQNPHMLVMSATPIPRTLALILYGDLDLSVIDELPPGRQTIDTYLVDESMRKRIEAFVRKQVAEGHQCYIVCPAIDETDDEEMRSVTAYANAIASKVFPDLRVLCLHGRMKGAEKEKIMAAFASGEADVLVSTTVVEVGVDNPNATLMVIENAERFGLSQLHQLRGRVGRGSAKSYCVLFCSDANARQRLDVMRRSNNGFEIAQQDLEQRGPGAFFGVQQHGLPTLRMANLTADMALLKEAQTAAAELLEEDPDLVAEGHTALHGRLLDLFDADKGNTFN